MNSFAETAALAGKDIVIGADGFLGRNLIKRLCADGRSVTAVGWDAGDLSHWPDCERAMSDAPKAERIFHVVTRQRTGDVQYKLQGELLAVNARVHLNVLEGWRRHQPQAKFVSTGSSCVYPERDRLLSEDDYQCGPMHPSVKGYGLAKQVLGVGAQVYAEQYGLRHLHCILATMYGLGDHKAQDRSHFIGAMLHRAVLAKQAGENQFIVWGDPETVREVLHVDDQIDAILAAEACFENELLNCAASEPVTIREAAKAVIEAIDWNAELYSPPGSFSGTSFKVLNSSRFLKVTGWQPKISLVQGLRSLYEAEYRLRA